MQSAFLFGGILPPPAPGAKILAGLDGAGAGCAADADETFVVEGVDGDMVGAGVVAHFVKRPIKQGVEFDELAFGVPFEGAHVAAVGRLFGADAGEPEVGLLQGAVEGFHFSDVTAFLSVFDGLVKTVGAFFGEERFEGRCLGGVGFYGLSVSLHRARPSRVGFLKIAPSIQCKYPNGQPMGKNKVRDDLVFYAKTGGERDFPHKPVHQMVQHLDGVESLRKGVGEVVECCLWISHGRSERFVVWLGPKKTKALRFVNRRAFASDVSF